MEFRRSSYFSFQWSYRHKIQKLINLQYSTTSATATCRSGNVIKPIHYGQVQSHLLKGQIWAEPYFLFYDTYWAKEMQSWRLLLWSIPLLPPSQVRNCNCRRIDRLEEMASLYNELWMWQETQRRISLEKKRCSPFSIDKIPLSLILRKPSYHFKFNYW